MTNIDKNKPCCPVPCLRVSKEAQEWMVAEGRLLTGDQMRERAAMFTEEQLWEKAHQLYLTTPIVVLFLGFEPLVS